MKVFVTGAAGRIGSAVVSELIRKDYQIVAADRVAIPKQRGIKSIQIDINDSFALKKELKGCQSLIHLAGLIYPQAGWGWEVFHTNACGTFTVLDAAATVGIRRAVIASSIHAMGAGFGSLEHQVDYLPINEEHPVDTSDVYSFSKQIVEEIAIYFWKRAGLSSISLRIPSVSENHRIPERWLDIRQKMQETFLLSRKKQRNWYRSVSERIQERKLKKHFPYQSNPSPLHSMKRRKTRPNPKDSAHWMDFACHTLKGSHFSTIPLCNLSQAMVQALHPTREGAHTLLISTSNNCLDLNTRALTQLMYPEISQFKKSLHGNQSLLDLTVMVPQN